MNQHVLSTHALSSLLAVCSTLPHLRRAHAFMLRRCLDRHEFFLSCFVDACSAAGFPRYAVAATLSANIPTTRLCNSAIRSLSRPFPHHALLLFNSMQVAAALRPDSYSFPFVLKAVVRLSSLCSGRQVHCQSITGALASDVHVAAALVEMYSKLGSVSDARKVFDETPLKDITLWNAMVAAHARSGDMDAACDVFAGIPERNVISWTAVIAGYAGKSLSVEALVAFRMMLTEGVRPDAVAMLAALSACADMGALELGKWIHGCIDKYELYTTVPLSNALIDMYAKSGDIEMALDLFEGMERRSLVTWTTMIDGLARHGMGREALLMFYRMVRAGVEPNAVTFIAVLSACCHSGLVEIGAGCFNSMTSRYKLELRIEHYGCLIDLLGRAGYLRRALALVMHMPFEPSAAIWGSILAAARIHGNPDLAEHAQHILADVEPHNGGNHMLLCNLYATLGRWEESGTVRKAMRYSGITKETGGSFIEVNSRVHDFRAGDKSHAQSERIREVLGHINSELKMGGFEQLECEIGA